MHQLIDRAAIAACWPGITRHVRRTPVLDAGRVGAADVWLKLEQLQHAGSFKTRGAFANLTMREVPKAGVAAASGGNHGAAVAYAAQQLGVPAKIFVPQISSPAKVERIRSYGADLVVGGAVYADALAASEASAVESGALRVHAFDQRETLLGAGTLGLEVEEQVERFDTIIAAVGGGGLLGGIAAALGGRVRVVGVEPEGCPTLHNALQAGRPVDAPVGGIAADSLGARRVGELMFPIAQAHVAQVVLVSDDDIRAAQRQLWASYRIVAEPGGAAAFAAVASGRYAARAGERVVVVVSGANTTAVQFDP
ncbi:MAG: threonine/serine dehydratase [Alphaproteobacteria bacterium]|nr:threonine/serine dehydratase [Alphaproteobacteria bacterium]